jgi:hypothetical protein
MRNKVNRILQRSFSSQNTFKPNFNTSFVLLGTVFSLKLVTYFFICHFDETTRRHFEKRLGDYRVIIRGRLTNQRPQFSIITFVIILILNVC